MPARLPHCGPSPPVTVSAVNTINDPSHIGAHSREGALGDPSSVLLAGLSYFISIVGGIGADEDGGKRGEGLPAAVRRLGDRTEVGCAPHWPATRRASLTSIFSGSCGQSIPWELRRGRPASPQGHSKCRGTHIRDVELAGEVTTSGWGGPAGDSNTGLGFWGARKGDRLGRGWPQSAASASTSCTRPAALPTQTQSPKPVVCP